MTLVEPVSTGASTARTLLFGGSGGEDTTAAFERSLVPVATASKNSGRRLGLLSRVGRSLVDQRLAAVADRMLDLDLADVLCKGWATYRKLTDAARQTIAVPGSEEVVELDSHRVTSAYHPFVQLLVDKDVVRTVRFDLVLVFEVEALLAILRGGELIAFRTGRCEVTAKLDCEGITLAGPQSSELEFPGLVWLEKPLRLAVAPSQ
jgi:hypothetical protein